MRWLLEEYRFRFRALALDELRDTETAELRDLVLVVNGGGGMFDERPGGVALLTRVVEAGGRVVAFGKAAQKLSGAAELPPRTFPRLAPFLEGVVVPARIDPAIRGRSSLLWGYERGPTLFWDGAAVWDPSSGGARTTFPLRFDHASESLCGLVSRAESAALEAGAAIAVVQAEGGGEWVFCGAPVASRGWNRDAFRLVFNSLLAPRLTLSAAGSDASD